MNKLLPKVKDAMAYCKPKMTMGGSTSIINKKSSRKPKYGKGGANY